MEKATETIEKYLAFCVKIHLTAHEKVLFCIWRKSDTPPTIMAKLGVTKGNLANYCKALIADKKITRTKRARKVSYEITNLGIKDIEKILEKVKNATL